MCVIIIREPNVDIPLDKLELACDINKHGYGISWVYKGKLKTEYSLKQPNDPKEVETKLKQLKSFRVFLHLRHATAGDITAENAHPFKLLTKSSDGMDLVLFHNGTLADWVPKDDKLKGKSDTWNFVNSFARPLARRCLSETQKEKLLDDQLFMYCMSREVGGWSKFLLCDNFGNYRRLGNLTDWKDFDGWRASNGYSFLETHTRSSKRPATTTPSYYSHGYGAYGSAYDFDDPVDPKEDVPGLPWKSETPKTTPLAPSLEEWIKTENPGTTKNPPSKDASRLEFEFEEVCGILWTNKVGPMAIKHTFHNLDVRKKSFTEQAYIRSIDDVADLTQEQFAELCDNYPQAMSYLFVECYAEIDELRKKLKEAHAGTVEKPKADDPATDKTLAC